MKLNIAIMRAEFRKIRDLFTKGGTKFEVPDYQRGFEWERSQFEDLWFDIQRLEDTEDIHYLGNIILLQQDSESYEIVDGQQRMVTISIFMMAIRDILCQDNQDDRRIENIVNAYPSDQTDPVRRIRLNDDEADEHFKNLWLGNSENIDGSIQTAYDYFLDRLNDVEQEKIESSLVPKIIKSLRIVETRSDTTSLAYMIFQSQNERGKDVSPAILAKARIFGAADREETRERQQKITGHWKKIYRRLNSELGGTRFRESTRVRRVLSHILINSESSTPAQISKSAFYRTFDEVVQQKNDVLKFVKDIDNQVDTYLQIASNDLDVEARDFSDDAEKSLQYLNSAATQGEVLSLSIITNTDDNRQREEFLRLASVIGMRMQLGGESSSDILDAIHAVASDVRESDDIRSTLRRSVRNRTPEDSEIIEYLKANSLTLDGSWRFRTLLILQSIENGRRTGTSLELGSLDIEHIAPRRTFAKSEYAEWRIGLDMEEFEENGKRDCLGNLTLLHKNDHSAIDESSFSRKSRAYRNSDIKIAQEIADIDTWNHEKIDERSERLAKELVNRWSI